MDKESAITLFEQGKKMEKRMLPDSAVIMYQRAIKQSATQKDIELTGIIYNQLGDLYLSHYLFNKSLSAYKLGLKYTQLSSDKTNKSKSLRGIGKSYTYNSKPDSGLIYLSQALLLSKSINDKEEVVRIHNNISNAYFELKQFKKALEHNSRALNITMDSTSKYINSFARADIMYQMQKYDSALYYYTIGTQCDNLNTRTGCYYMLYKLSSLLNKPDSAYYLSHFTTIRDSIEEANHPDLIQSAENNYLTDNIIKKKNNNLSVGLGFILFLSSITFLITISTHKIKLKNHERAKEKEIKKYTEETNELQRKLAIYAKEKERQAIKLSQTEATQKLSLIQNRIVNDIKIHAIECSEDFMKSQLYNEMKIHFRKDPSLLTTKEQKKLLDVINKRYHTTMIFANYLR